MAPIRPNPTLSEDLIIEILVRVPVESLHYLKIVCKAWLSLIKDPAFVKSQLLHTTQSDQTLIISHHPECQLDYISLLDVSCRQIVADVKLPCQGESYNRLLFGSANGIVCVFFHIDVEINMCLWNPATRQSKLIPPSINKCFPMGFGYDPIDDEYKVVNVRYKGSSVDVYLANRDEWRKGLDPIDSPYPIDPSIFHVCVNGFLCGTGHHGMKVFDLHTEVLNSAIKLPVPVLITDDDEEDDDDKTRIIEFNKSIAVIILWDKGSNAGKKINMWLLDDDACLGRGGVEASWTPMFSIDIPMPASRIFGYFNNRDLLLLTIDTWISCNTDKKEAKIVPLFEMSGTTHRHYINNVYKYTESLVSLPGFKQINWNAGEDDKFGNPADFDIFVPDWLK